MADINTSKLIIGDNGLVLQDAAARASMAPAYSASSTYAVGDIVLKDGQLYECTTAISTAEAWTVAHWTAVTVGGELSSLKEDLNESVDDLKSETNELWLGNEIDTLSTFSATPKYTTKANGASITDDALTIPSGSTGYNSCVGLSFQNASSITSLVGRLVHIQIVYNISNVSELVAQVAMTTQTAHTSSFQIIKSSFNPSTKTMDAYILVKASGATYFAPYIVVKNSSAFASECVISVASWSATIADNEYIFTQLKDEVDNALVTDWGESFTLANNLSDSWITFDANTKTAVFESGHDAKGKHLGYMTRNIAPYRGKTIKFSFPVTISGDTDAFYAWSEINSGSGITVTCAIDNGSYNATVTFDENANANYILFAIRGSYTYGSVLASTTTIVVGDFQVATSDLKGVVDATGWGTSRSRGLKMSCFGDSYTAQNRWQPTIKALLGLSEYVNTAISGGTLVDNYASVSNIATDSDIVTFWYGTNDYANNKPLGTMEDSAVSPTTFYGCLKYCFEWLSTNCPKAVIVPITHTKRFASTTDIAFIANNGYGANGEPKNNLGYTLEDYTNAVCEVAEYYAYDTLDLHHKSGVNANSASSFYDSDGLHPSYASGVKIAYWVASYIHGK